MVDSPNVYRIRGVEFPLCFEMEGNRWTLRKTYDDQRHRWNVALDGPTWWHIATFSDRSSLERQLRDTGIVIDGHTFLDRIFSHLVKYGIAERGALNAARAAQVGTNGDTDPSASNAFAERDHVSQPAASARQLSFSRTSQHQSNAATAVRMRARQRQAPGFHAPRILVQPGA
jgi:hypothetical protein